MISRLIIIQFLSILMNWKYQMRKILTFFQAILPNFIIFVLNCLFIMLQKIAKDLNINYLTIHISSGLTALKACKKISGKTKLIGVTTLTSLDNKSLKEIGYSKSINQLVYHQVKLAKISGEFIWHKHDTTDELFYIIKGNMKIIFKDGTVDLSEGEMYIVPKGVDHKPIAEKECHIMLIEPKGILNTGEFNNELTAKLDDWV